MGSSRSLQGSRELGPKLHCSLFAPLLLSGASNLEFQCSQVGQHQDGMVWTKVLNAFFPLDVMPSFDSHIDI